MIRIFFNQTINGWYFYLFHIIYEYFYPFPIKNDNEIKYLLYYFLNILPFIVYNKDKYFLSNFNKYMTDK